MNVELSVRRVGDKWAAQVGDGFVKVTRPCATREQAVAWAQRAGVLLAADGTGGGEAA